MRETCYSCGLPFAPGDPCAVLEDEHGQRWKVHVQCLNDDFKAAEEEPGDANG